MSTDHSRRVLLDDADHAGAAYLRARSGHRNHDVLVVLGTGLAPLADTWWDTSEDTYAGHLSDLGSVPKPGSEGHPNEWRSLDISGRRALVALGRSFLFEHADPRPATAMVRVAAAAGIGRVVLSSASGAITPWNLGEVVTVTDHLNLTGRSPFGAPIFFDPRQTWDVALRDATRGLTDHAGTFAQTSGPEFQTVAECRLLAAHGADVAGMSTVHEALMAAALGMRVCGLSVISDLSYDAQPVTGEAVIGAITAAHRRMRYAIEAAVLAE